MFGPQQEDLIMDKAQVEITLQPEALAIRVIRVLFIPVD